MHDEGGAKQTWDRNAEEVHDDTRTPGDIADAMLLLNISGSAGEFHPFLSVQLQV
jgi:hypothetical protein